jgi:hypothetical protein
MVFGVDNKPREKKIEQSDTGVTLPCGNCRIVKQIDQATKKVRYAVVNVGAECNPDNHADALSTYAKKSTRVRVKK